MNAYELELHFEEIKKMYLEDNMSPEKIGEYFNSKRYQINYLLQKHGIQKHLDERRKYTLDINFFDTIDTPNKAYILGFLYSDGYNNRVNNTIVLSLSKEDEDTLEKIRQAIGTNKPLYYVNYINKHDGVERNLVNLTLASKHMCESLEKIGLSQNKTFTIQFPDFLSNELYPHFIRGYFDGDGCAYIYKHKRFTTSIMSSLDFCYGMQKFLLTQGINFHVNVASKHPGNGLIRTSNYNENYKFMQYIYNDAELYMERKYNKFKEFFPVN